MKGEDIVPSSYESRRLSYNRVCMKHMNTIMLTVISRNGREATCSCTECGCEFTTGYHDALKSRLGHLCSNCSSPSGQEVNQALLKKFLHYDPLTGIVTNRLIRHGCNVGDVLGVVGNTGYLRISFAGQPYLLHRLIWLYMTGTLPDKVDHLNHNKLDNSWVNLREVNNTDNSKNCSVSKNSSTKVNGVSFMKSRSKYRAYIMVARKQISLGLFANIDDAVAARKAADIKYDFHSNHGN